MAPSLTETLFALGVGQRVVGVTRYCAYPPEVRNRARVGGHLDPNFEAIVALEPDLVVLIPSGEASARRLEALGVPVLQIDQHDVRARTRRGGGAKTWPADEGDTPWAGKRWTIWT